MHQNREGSTVQYTIPSSALGKRMSDNRSPSFISKTNKIACDITMTILEYGSSRPPPHLSHSPPGPPHAAPVASQTPTPHTPLFPVTCSCCCAFHTRESIPFIFFTSSKTRSKLNSLPGLFEPFVSFTGSSNGGFRVLLPPNEPVQIGASYVSRTPFIPTGTAGTAGISTASSFVCRIISCTL